MIYSFCDRQQIHTRHFIVLPSILPFSHWTTIHHPLHLPPQILWIPSYLPTIICQTNINKCMWIWIYHSFRLIFLIFKKLFFFNSFRHVCNMFRSCSPVTLSHPSPTLTEPSLLPTQPPSYFRFLFISLFCDPLSLITLVGMKEKFIRTWVP